MSRWPATIDASPIFSPNRYGSVPFARRTFAAELVSILKTCSFARVRNHGVAAKTTERLFKLHRYFFDLPLATKLTVQHAGGGSPARGYSPWAYEKAAIRKPDLHTAPSLPPTQHPHPHALLDAREQFTMGPPSDVTFKTPQLAEEDLPGFNAAVADAYRQMAETCRELVRVIEEGLGAPRGSITGQTADGEGTELNLNYYPQARRGTIADALGRSSAGEDNADRSGYVAGMRRIWPHSDLGVVCAIFQDRIGESGLEVYLREPEPELSGFVPVSVDDENDMILFVSDTLERWTNGQLQAAVHRVGLPPATPGSKRILVPKRSSAVMSFRAPPTADLYPLSHFISAKNPARPWYKHITAGEYLKHHNDRINQAMHNGTQTTGKE
ncbi:hypothetical protein SAMD00023353_1700600 [Rosellinia necatrix]|uniref:Uncharacterized protein n=1 Tax=Rosellinia necatrix TaxID=77044 RepID=A0A1W2TKU5_ROSNE|nr:hypothetical protein SAMD00023353_1700600 [Rosellinia necatrix]